MKKDSDLTEPINEILRNISKEQREKIMATAIEQQPGAEDEATGGFFFWVKKIVEENGIMFLRGAGMTLLISLIGTILGTAIGMAIGIFRTIPTPKKAG